LLELKRGGATRLLGHGELHKNKKAAAGLPHSKHDFIRIKYTTGYWKVKENLVFAKWFFADFDREGRIDAAVTTIGARIELWWNRSSRSSGCSCG
jgi:hypothetical protein